MNIGILGCGSLGGVIAGKLWSALGDAVRVFELNPAIVDAVRKDGLRVNDGRLSFIAHPRILGGPKEVDGKLDLIILTTKSPGLDGAVGAFLPVLSESGCFMTVQNGLVALDLIEKYGEDRVVAGCVMWGASVAGPGVYDVTASGPFVVGGIDGRENPRVELCRKALSAGFPVETSADMRDVLWAKLSVTASLTSLGAVTALNFGEMLRRRDIRELILRVGREVVEVGRASGVRFLHSEGALDVNLLTGDGFPPRWIRHLLVRAIGLRHRRTDSSMLASIRAGQPTELAFVNGIVIEMGKMHGIDTPVNAAIARVVGEIEGGDRAPGRESYGYLTAILD